MTGDRFPRYPPGYMGAAGLAGIGASVALTLATGLLGPSAVQARLPGSGPPFALGAHPPAELVVGMQIAALGLGAAGLALSGLAVRRGWSPAPRRLLAAGVLAGAALVCVPPVGTADPHAYAAYGRMVTLGANPYAAAPEDFPGDPVASAAKPPWTQEPSPYGPLATAEQAVVSWIVGDGLRLTVFVLSVVNAAAFVATGLILYALARGDRGRQQRAALLWTLNPVLLYLLVAGAHLDALAILAAVAAVAALGRWPLGSGALVGAAASIKAPVALTGAGLLWGARRARQSWVRGGAPVAGGAALVAGGAALVAAAAYGIAGPGALGQLGRTSGYISLATPWHLAEGPLTGWLGGGVARGLIQTLAYSALLAVAALFAYALPQRRDGHASTGAARVALALGLAWLLTAPYVLPWYDALAWAFLAVLPWSRFDALLLTRTTLLAVPYVASLPARLPPDMVWLVELVRARMMPVLMLVLTAGFVLEAARRGLPRRPARRQSEGSRG